MEPPQPQPAYVSSHWGELGAETGPRGRKRTAEPARTAGCGWREVCYRERRRKALEAFGRRRHEWARADDGAHIFLPLLGHSDFKGPISREDAPDGPDKHVTVSDLIAPSPQTGYVRLASTVATRK